MIAASSLAWEAQTVKKMEEVVVVAVAVAAWVAKARVVDVVNGMDALGAGVAVL
jgi:hypothetical protein